MHIWCQQRRWETTILLFLLPFLILKFRHTHISLSGQILHPLLSLRATKGRIKASRDKNEFWLELDGQGENHLVPGFQVIPVCHPHLPRDRHHCERLPLPCWVECYNCIQDHGLTRHGQNLTREGLATSHHARTWTKKDKYNTNNNTRAAKHCFIF